MHHTLLSHTHLGTPRIAKFRGSLFLMYAILILIKIWNSESNAYIKGELNLNFWNSKASILSIFISLSLLSSITKKGEFVSAFAPDVGFDN